ncbi:unnamed protein product [Onchocerca flexuosa]|uniref:Transposase n=1 Tax=Onchocerca flexuosa TaxID=387005 RepID=A0A183HT96_9BILA|nr:unnamed protein product [Onchocerca flexuosa]
MESLKDLEGTHMQIIRKIQVKVKVDITMQVKQPTAAERRLKIYSFAMRLAIHYRMGLVGNGIKYIAKKGKGHINYSHRRIVTIRLHLPLPCCLHAHIFKTFGSFLTTLY